jgi:NapC/NirT cytochrome c family, N-terminal region
MSLMQRVRSFLRLVALSRLAIVGATITTLAFLAYIALTLGELFIFRGNPYWGIALNVIFPAIAVMGLLLIAVGIYFKQRALRLTLGDESVQSYADRRNINRTYVWQVVAILTLINGAFFAYFSYHGYHFTESREFCGELCHVVMEPEHVVYARSPHSEISCVVCHIGEGATWFVKSKLSGMRQVYGVLTGDYSRPIETPVKNLRPARDVCEVCHRPEIFHGNRIQIIERFAKDRENTLKYTVLNLRIGSGGEKVAAHGIHWHVSKNHEIQYYASDEKREQIDWVTTINADGESHSWTRPGSDVTPSEIEEDHIRTMDCVDCHNRPTHIYLPADKVMNDLLTHRRIDRTIPWIRAYGEEIISRQYETKELGLAGIAELGRIYQERDLQAWTEYQPQIEAAIPVLQEMYSTYVYPRMNIEWNTYPSLIGHPVQSTSACFRCHDGLLVDEEGKSPATECDACHFVLAREETDPMVLKVLVQE